MPCRNESKGNVDCWFQCLITPRPFVFSPLSLHPQSEGFMNQNFSVKKILTSDCLAHLDAKIATSIHHFHTSTILVQACVAEPLQLNEKVGRRCIKSLPSCLLCRLGERSTIHDKSVRTPIASTNYTMPHCVAAAVRQNSLLLREDMI